MKQNVMKRTLAGVLAVLTVAAYMPANVGGFLTESTGIVMGVSAEGEAQVSTAADLKTAVEAGQSVQLTANIALTETLNVTEDVTIDLNGYNVTADGCRAFHVKSGTLTLAGNGTVSSTGAVDKDSSVIRVGANDMAGSALYVGEKVTIQSDKCYGITAFGTNTAETIDVYGTVTVTGENSAISGNGNKGWGNTTINVYPGAVVSAANDVAIYHPQTGTLNITGGTITGKGGIEAKAGTVNISGTPSITATAEEYHAKNGNGTSTKGYSISAVENSGYVGAPTFNISGGTFTGSFGVVADDEVEAAKKGSVSVTGGTFSTNVSAYVAQGYEVYQSGASYTVKNVAVATIGETRYATLQDAINAAQAGETVKALSDIAIQSSPVIITKNVTIDLNGRAITGDNTRAFWVKSGKLTLSGTGTVSSTGSNLNADSSVIRVGADDMAGSALDVGEKVTIQSDKCYGITAFGKNTAETVDVYGTVTVTGVNSAISGNGNKGYGNTTINIHPGAVVSAANDVAIYHPQAGTLNITGGTITGKGGVEAKTGTVNISGTPSITATAEETSHNANGNGTSTRGYAIAAVENSGYVGSPEFNISGGTFNGKVGIEADNEVTSDKKATITISGGRFFKSNGLEVDELDRSFIADGYAQYKFDFGFDSNVVKLSTLDENNYITVTSIDVNGNKTSTKVYPDFYGADTYTIPKAFYLDGMIFTSWAFFDESGEFINSKEYESDAQQLANQLVSSEKDFTVKLQYSPDGYGGTLTVDGGTITSSPRTPAGYPASDYISRNDLVKVSADNAAAFSYWVKIEGNKETIVSYNSTYTFYMPEGDVTLKAVFNQEVAEPQATANIESVTPNISTGKVSFVSVINVPQKAKFVKGGLVATSDATIGKNVTADNAAYVKLSTAATSNTKNLKYTWTKSKVTTETIWYVRSYVVYKDSKGVEHTVYSDAVKANINGVIQQ